MWEKDGGLLRYIRCCDSDLLIFLCNVDFKENASRNRHNMIVKIRCWRPPATTTVSSLTRLLFNIAQINFLDWYRSKGILESWDIVI